MILAGGGEMGALTRAYDWEKTPLGPPRRWPQSLRTTVRLLLNTKCSSGGGPRSSSSTTTPIATRCMPHGITGLELARRAQRLRPGLRVLLTSGYTGAELSRLGGLSPFELIRKPFRQSD